MRGAAGPGVTADRDAAAQPRAIGTLAIATRWRDGVSVLETLRQSGSSRAMFPRRAGPGVTAVTLNTAGGITGGDRFAFDATAGPGTRLMLTTQAAERIYRAQPHEVGRVETRLTVAAGARLDWIPQETIVFHGAALDRRLDVTLDSDATLLLVEPMILGRAAMGETVRAAHLRDRIMVRRGGVPVFADALRLDGDVAATMARRATGGGAGAMAAVLLVAANAENMVAPARALLTQYVGGVSLISPGVLFARLLASDGYALRAALMPLLSVLRGAPLPRVWTM